MGEFALCSSSFSIDDNGFEDEEIITSLILAYNYRAHFFGLFKKNIHFPVNASPKDGIFR